MSRQENGHERRESLPAPSPEPPSTPGLTEITFFTEPASPEPTSPGPRASHSAVSPEPPISPEPPASPPISPEPPSSRPGSPRRISGPVPFEPPDLPELPDNSVADGARTRTVSHTPSESVWSSLPEVVPGWEHNNTPERVDPVYVKVSDLIALPSDNEGLEVAGYVPRPYPIAPDADGGETIETKHTTWIKRKRNRMILVIGALVLLLIIAGITAGVAAGIIINRNNTNAQQGNSNDGANGNGGGDSGGGGSGGGGGTTTVTHGPPGPAGTAPVAPTAPTGPAPPMLPTRTGFGVPTSFPEPQGGISQQSTCTGSMCPQMLAVAQYSNTRVSTMFMFARGLDAAIWYRQAENQVWLADWKSLGGNFLSQPAAISIREGRVDVYGVWSADRTARSKTFQNGVWDEDWTNFGGNCGAPPAVCSLYAGNINLVIVDSDHAVLRKNTSDGHSWEPGVDKWNSLGGSVGTSVDIACTSTTVGGMRLDLAAFAQGSTPGMFSKRWTSSSAAWEKDWGHGWGLMKGDPTVVSTERQVDYLGVGLDEAVWVRSWTEADGYVKEVNLGGKFQSAVSAFATGGSRLDIFAVGTDARLKHLARMHGVWGTAWEDLGGYFHSAPKAVVTDVPTGSVSVFGIGPNGAIIHANFMVGAGYNWGTQPWYSDGGQISANWLRYG
ncbi:hypothetical protein OQA88_5923 [Cercophora sp. LCS_1]